MPRTVQWFQSFQSAGSSQQPGRVSIAMVLPGLTCLVQWYFWSAIEPYAWFLFYPTVFLAVLLGRLWGGILATMISAVLVWYVFIPPQLSFVIASPSALISTVVFVISGIALSVYYEHLFQDNHREAKLAGDARFQLLFEQSMDGMMITDADGSFVEVNSRLCALTGYSREELVGQNIAILLLEGDRESMYGALCSGAGLSALPSEWTLVAKAGARVPVEVTVCQFPDGSWSAIVRDISERRQAEVRERAAEAKFHAFMDAIPAVAWIKDAAGNYIYLNKAWGNAFGVRREDWLGKPTSALLPAPIAVRLAASDQTVRRTGQAIEVEEETVDFEGNVQQWRSIKFPVHTAASLPMLGGVAIEITGQRQAAEALRSSDELNRAVLDSVPSQVAVLNRDGIIIAVNQAWRNFARENSSAGAGDVQTGVGANFLEVCWRQAAECGGNENSLGANVFQAVFDLLQGQTERFSCECPCHTNTRQQWFLLNVTPLQIPTGGAVVSYYDITEIKLSQELQQAAAAQLKAMAAKHLAVQEEERRLLSLELHDHIGQILTGLQLHLHALRSEVRSNSRGTVLIREAIIAVDELVGTIRDITRRLRPPALDDLGLASAVRWHVSQIAGSSNMLVDLQHNLDERRLAPALELACFRVLQEAISNALRHSGAARLSIALSLELDGLHLSVKDDGIGFSVDETFKRLHNLASLGLIGMRERVASLGGRFDINSNPEMGTEIAAYFPLPP